MAFLEEIGIPCAIEAGAAGFIQGVKILNGELRVSPDAFVGDVLHEAGHLAVLPGRFRALASGNIIQVQKLMMEAVDFSDPDVGEARAAMQTGDGEATAWAWAAGMHLGLQPEAIVRDREYGGSGKDVKMALSLNGYLGINGLAAAGFCVTRTGELERIRGLPAYPKLAMWLQRDFVQSDQEAVGAISSTSTAAA